MTEDFRIKVFIEVARQGNFTKAAGILGVSQPAVSANIAELEKDLGAELFRRDRTGVTLTPAGSSFLEYATRIQHWYQAAAKLFTKTSYTRTIRINADPAILESILPAALAKIAGTHPDAIFETTNDEADITIKVAPRKDTMSLEEGSTLIGVLPAIAVTKSEAEDDEEIDEHPVASWKGYRSLLPPDIYASVMFQTDSCSAIIEMVDRIPGLVGIIPAGAKLPEGIKVIPTPLPHLTLDVTYSVKTRQSASSSLIPQTNELADLLRSTLENLLRR
ncbi:MAG: LysR family transcriptional regulator [Bacteroidales bacterium]|nr:LysR family transcriptional regulator [Bacteroidales bacterium]